MELYNDDCLKVMKEFESNSIDLLFCDLPYGQTSCKWDCLIDLDEFWKQVNRICKDTTPMFFTCSTKFGVSLINSNPKNFRYDLVWVKSAPCGFLNAKKMPMKKHEMIYVFYKKLPLYDLSSHSHKFLKETENKRNGKDGIDNKGMIKNRSKTEICNKYEPPLPTSVVKEESYITTTLYSDKKGKPRQVYRAEEGKYDPPLPTSVIRNDEGCKSMYGEEKKKVFIYDEEGKLRNSEPRYDPPLPTSVVREEETFIRGKKKKSKEDVYGADGKMNNAESYRFPRHHLRKGDEPIYDPPLPNSILEVASEKGKHATQKPVGLIEFCLKYYSKEGDKVLDPTMGSGSTGVACKNMNRHFIGIEMNKEIYDIAVERLNK